MPADAPAPDSRFRAGRTSSVAENASAVPVGLSFGGFALADLTPDGAVDWITQAAAERRAALVITPNIFHLHLVRQSEVMREGARRAALQLADGWPLILASRLLGSPLPGRIAGIDLVERLLDADHRFSIAVLGGPPSAAERLAERARSRNDVILVDDLTPGWTTPERRAGLRDRLVEARPDLVLIGISAPRQYELALDLVAVLDGVVIGCGAAVEVLAGLRPRAPRRVQAVGLEWAFRMAIEPRRLAQRYVLSGATFTQVLVRALLRRWLA